MNNIWILAQAHDADAPSGVTSGPITTEQTSTTVAASDANAPGAGAREQKPFIPPVVLLILMFVVMYLILFRGPRKKQQQHKKMVQTLQKNDRVRTIGGIIGTIVDVRDDEITLKIDESNNTKIKIATSAIGKNLLRDNN